MIAESQLKTTFAARLSAAGNIQIQEVCALVREQAFEKLDATLVSHMLVQLTK
jgi:hypothetical protein